MSVELHELSPFGGLVADGFEYQDVVASIGIDFAFVQFLGWIISGQV